MGTRDDHVWELDRGDGAHVVNVLTPLNWAIPLLSFSHYVVFNSS